MVIDTDMVMEILGTRTKLVPPWHMPQTSIKFPGNASNHIFFFCIVLVTRQQINQPTAEHGLKTAKSTGLLEKCDNFEIFFSGRTRDGVVNSFVCCLISDANKRPILTCHKTYDSHKTQQTYGNNSSFSSLKSPTPQIPERVV